MQWASPCPECDAQNKALWSCGAVATSAQGPCYELDNHDTVDPSTEDSALDACLGQECGTEWMSLEECNETNGCSTMGDDGKTYLYDLISAEFQSTAPEK